MWYHSAAGCPAFAKNAAVAAPLAFCEQQTTDDGKIVLIRQYRYAVDNWVWEVPAGGKHDHDGSDEELAHLMCEPFLQ